MLRKTTLRNVIMGALGACLAIGFGAAPAMAQEYPNRPIRLVVGWGPGGAVDILARLIAQKMGDKYGQKVFVENRPGANATIGADNVARAAPDGYSILIVTSSHIMTPAMKQTTSYDPITSFAPITEIATVPSVVLVRPELGVKTLDAFIKMLKAAPAGKYNFASTGAGSSNHLIGLEFNQSAGVELTHIPYQGAGAALTAMLSGEVDAYFGSVSGSKAYVEDGKIVALAVPQATRATVMPEVPTTAEAGLPNFQFITWYGMLAPAKTPAAIVNKLSQEFHEIMELPDVKARLMKDGIEPALSNPDEFRAFMIKDMQNINDVVSRSGITAN